MKLPRVSLCMIVRDCESDLHNCLSSLAGHVDQIVVVDTGSVDRTREVATRHGASVYQFDHRNHPEAFFVDDEKTGRELGLPPAYSGRITLGDFAAARNESFAHADGDAIMWVDSDDVVLGAENIRARAKDMLDHGLTAMFLRYDYAVDEQGRVHYAQWRERIVRPRSGKWFNVVHEVFVPSAPTVPARFDDIVISHRRKPDRPMTPHRNYKLLLRELHRLGVDRRDRAALAKVDPRLLFYLGQEARFVDNPQARIFYEVYLTHSGWPEERSAAHHALGELLEFNMIPPIVPGADPLEEANQHFAAAALEMPGNPDGIFGAARIAYLRQRWQDCINYTERGLAMNNPESLLGMSPLNRLYRPHLYLNHALAMVGRLEDAANSCRAALQICPDDPPFPGGASGMMNHNLRRYESELARRKEHAPMTQDKRPLVEFDVHEDLDAPPVPGIPPDAFSIWAIQLWKQIVMTGDGVRAHQFLGSLPAHMQQAPAMQRLRAATDRRFPAVVARPPLAADALAEALKPAPHSFERLQRALERSFDALKIVIWTGPAFEAWDPSTPSARGIGGSETAAAEMAAELAARGHRVRLYGNAPAGSGAKTGPFGHGQTPFEYLHFDEMKSGLQCDVFIASRAPQTAEILRPGGVEAKLALLWVHDIHVGPLSPQLERQLLRFDRILCLSEWHKGFFLSQYPMVHPDRVIVTRNGIDPRRFMVGDPSSAADTALERIMPKRRKMVWSSSPNRGLPRLLEIFTEIERQVPDVELDIFYGFDCWEAFAKMRNAHDELGQIRAHKDRIQEAIAASRGRVRHHGRVDQTRLAKAFLAARVWGYPTDFPETSCITAMEAQAAGCVPVCTALAALPETVKHGILIAPENPLGVRVFVDACVKLLLDDQVHATYAEPGRRHALQNLSWRALAADWEAAIRRWLSEIAANPLPAWWNG